MKSNQKQVVKVLIVIIIILVSVVGYLISVKKGGVVQESNSSDKNLLTNAFKSIPVYSTNSTCDATRFDAKDNYFDYNPNFRCSYNSNQNLEKVMERYKNELENTGWTCIYDEYFYQRAAGKRKAYSTTYIKEDFALDIYLTTLPEGTIWNGKQIELSIEKISDNRMGLVKNTCDSWKGFEE